MRSWKATGRVRIGSSAPGRHRGPQGNDEQVGHHQQQIEHQLGAARPRQLGQGEGARAPVRLDITEVVDVKDGVDQQTQGQGNEEGQQVEPLRLNVVGTEDEKRPKGSEDADIAEAPVLVAYGPRRVEEGEGHADDTQDEDGPAGDVGQGTADDGAQRQSEAAGPIHLLRLQDAVHQRAIVGVQGNIGAPPEVKVGVHEIGADVEEEAAEERQQQQGDVEDLLTIGEGSADEHGHQGRWERPGPEGEQPGLDPRENAHLLPQRPAITLAEQGDAGKDAAREVRDGQPVGHDAHEAEPGHSLNELTQLRHLRSHARKQLLEPVDGAQHVGDARALEEAVGHLAVDGEGHPRAPTYVPHSRGTVLDYAQDVERVLLLAEDRHTPQGLRRPRRHVHDPIVRQNLRCRALQRGPVLSHISALLFRCR